MAKGVSVSHGDCGECSCDGTGDQAMDHTAALFRHYVSERGVVGHVYAGDS